MLPVYKLRWFFVFLGLLQSAGLLAVWLGVIVARSELLSWTSDYMVKMQQFDNATNDASRLALVTQCGQTYVLLGAIMPVLLFSTALLLVETYAVYFVLKRLHQYQDSLAVQSAANPTPLG
jgi:phosphatidylglycerophosphate synthase